MNLSYHSRLLYNDNIVEKADWRWCEWKKNMLYWAERGCLYKASLEKNALLGKPSLIYDFELEVFVK